MQATRPVESLPNVKAAALRRLSEARRLLWTGAFDGSIYLAGYAAEMTLKLAYFVGAGTLANPANIPRMARSPVLKDLVIAARGTAQTEWAARFASANRPFPSSWKHDLRVWSILVVQFMPLVGRAASELEGRSAAIAASWSVEMRYVRVPASYGDARSLVADVAWLVRRYCP